MDAYTKMPVFVLQYIQICLWRHCAKKKKTHAILSATSIHVVSPSDSILKMIYESNNNFQTQLTRSTFVLCFRLYTVTQLPTFE
jgi:hypothetical protein